jgi:hypothetical protein
MTLVQDIKMVASVDWRKSVPLGVDISGTAGVWGAAVDWWTVALAELVKLQRPETAASPVLRYEPAVVMGGSSGGGGVAAVEALLELKLRDAPGVLLDYLGEIRNSKLVDL